MSKELPTSTRRANLGVVTAFGLITGLVVHVSAHASGTDSPDFAKEVAPILVGRCLDCHSGDRPAGKLDLSTERGLHAGSESGSVLDLDDLDASLLIEVVQNRRMPPKKSGTLSEAEIQVLARWVKGGGRWSGEALVPGSVTTDRRAGLDWWSLQPIRQVSPPQIDDPARAANPIDRFVLSSLDTRKIIPRPLADRRTLIRRLSYDLLGVPPTYAEVEAFVLDDAPDAYERLVDRLLASPRMGEQSARHWLDVVRFAESHGYEHDSPRPNAWRYRDFVVRAFNEDLGYDQFVIQQLAGDVAHPGDSDALAATGFLVAGPFDEVGSKIASPLMRASVRQDELEDLIGVTSQAFLGLTIHCARCHHHKFDPVQQDDYYGLAAVFAGVRHGGAEADRPPAYVPKRTSPEPVRLLARGDLQSPGRLVEPNAPRAIRTIPNGLDLGNPDNEGARRLAFARWLVDRRNPLTARVIVNRLWQRHFGRGLVGTPSDFGFNGARPTHPELLDWLASELITNSWKLKPIHRLILRSNAYRRSGATDPAAMSVDSENQGLWRFTTRRLDAEELRDTVLAVSGQLNPQIGGPGYALFESKTNAGTLYKPVDRDGPEFRRRSLYRMIVRGTEAPLLAAFDCPDGSVTAPARNVTTTPLQALALWNDPFIRRNAEALAERMARETPVPAERVLRLFRVMLGRDPNPEERRDTLAYAHENGWADLAHVIFNTNEFLFVD